MCHFLSFAIDKKENVYFGDLYTHDSIYRKYKGNIENLIECEWKEYKLEIRSKYKSFYEASILGRWKSRNDLIKYIFDNKLSDNTVAYYDNNNDFIYVIKHSNGTKYWYKNGLRHRDNDLPAKEFSNGDKYWYKNGLRHRDNDLPACECFNGNKYWYKNDKLHRDNDLPACEYSNGTKYWYKNGKLIK